MQQSRILIMGIALDAEQSTKQLVSPKREQDITSVQSVTGAHIVNNRRKGNVYEVLNSKAERSVMPSERR